MIWNTISALSLSALVVLIVVPAYAEPKYRLKDCIVRVDLLWPERTMIGIKHEILRKADTFWKQAIASGNYPLFSFHYTRPADHYFAYFADQCEKRELLTKNIIDHEVMPKVSKFPSFSISLKGFKIGEDGVMPGGWWIEE